MVIPPVGLPLLLASVHQLDLEDVGEADHDGGVQAEQHPAQVVQAVTLNVVSTFCLLERKYKCRLHHKNVAKN